MEPLAVFIADAEEKHIQRARAVLSQCRELSLTGCASDGQEALVRVSRLSVDILLLDTILPGMDGLTLLEKLNGLGRHPVSIICTRFFSRESIKIAMRAGAACMLHKPLNYASLPRVLVDCYRANAPHETAVHVDGEDERALWKGVIDLGFSPGLIGTGYVLAAITLLWREPTLLQNLSQGLYREIACAVDCNTDRVEHALRRAIAMAYDHGRIGGHFDRRPSNREFFRFLMPYLHEKLSASCPSPGNASPLWLPGHDTRFQRTKTHWGSIDWEP